MWLCDGCQAINDDDSVTVCPKCGTANEPVPLHPMHPTAPVAEVVDSTTAQPTIAATTASSRRLTLQPLYIGIGIIVFAELLPFFHFGVDDLPYAVLSGLALGWAAYNIWKETDLFTQGVQIEGTVVLIDFVPDMYNQSNFDPFASPRGTYHTIVEYVVDGCPWQVRSQSGTQSPYQQIGGIMPVWYDPTSPSIASIGSPIGLTPVLPILLGIFLYVLPWLLASQRSGLPRL
jgi:hypothetical protein